MSAANIDIVADRRVPYFEQYAFIGVNWAGSTWSGQLRSVKDSTGAPLIDFTPGVILDYAGTDTVANHIAAGRLTADIFGLINPATGANYVNADSVLLSWLRVSLDVPSIADVPIPNPPGGDVTVWYDIIRHPLSAGDEIVMRGKFTVRAGVTIP